MNRYGTPAILFSAVIIILLSFCGACNGHPKDRVPADSRLEKITIKKDSSNLDDVARFLAGSPVKDASKYQKIISSNWYRKYRSNIEKSWKGFFSPNMEKIRNWREKNITGQYSTSVFYPFSGPDVLNPLLFYPEARDILMFGLEPTGESRT